MERTGTITADPNPIPVSDYALLGVTTLTWKATGAEVVEVRIGAPDGPLFIRSGPDGCARTGEWVSEGTVFYLQDVSGGLPLSAANTLTQVTAQLTPAGLTASLPERAEEIIARLAPGCVLGPRVSEYFRYWEAHGFHVTPVHFYQPIPDTRTLGAEL